MFSSFLGLWSNAVPYNKTPVSDHRSYATAPLKPLLRFSDRRRFCAYHSFLLCSLNVILVIRSLVPAVISSYCILYLPIALKLAAPTSLLGTDVFIKIRDNKTTSKMCQFKALTFWKQDFRLHTNLQTPERYLKRSRQAHRSHKILYSPSCITSCISEFILRISNQKRVVQSPLL